MRFPRSYRLAELAEILNCSFKGSEAHQVLGMNEIHVVEPGDLVFVDHPKYYDKALQSAATTILINKEVEVPKGKGILISSDPFRDFNRLALMFKPFEQATSAIAPSATIGEGTEIQPNCFIGNEVRIGKNCRIHANVSIYDGVVIGDHVTIHANAILGADAFYYKRRPEGYDKLISCGTVVIEDYVDLGAGCTIDRGVTAATTIKKGSKLDNQVHVGHDTVVGEHCLIASGTGLAGCVIVEDEVTLWGQVGVTSGVTIGKKAVVLGQSGVSKSLPGGKTYYGSPAEEVRKKYREMASVRLLPSLLEQTTFTTKED
jgi:UDP-3-O-[3-hydroxymyristoyl] glucosamine N-acyltransferase